MSRLRTSLSLLAVGGTAVAVGLVAGSATAAPAPVAAVSALQADDADGPPGADADEARPGGMMRGGRHGAGQWWDGLTDEQRQCLTDADLTRPVFGMSDEERTALREKVTATAEACGVELPLAKARGAWNRLTDEQRQCLEDADVTRPVGPMGRDARKDARQDVRQDLRDAAAKCGIELPERQRPTAEAS